MRYYKWTMLISHKTTATALILASLCLLLLPVPWLHGYTPTLGPWWHITHMEVLFYQDAIETYTDVASFRRIYPAYNDMDDVQLARRLHEKYFGDLSLKDYSALFFFTTGAEAASPPAAGDKHPDPVMIRGEIQSYRDLDPISKAIVMSDAIDYGLYGLRIDELSVLYIYPFSAGVVLLALGVYVFIASRKKKASE